jgi:hypothetical protein
MPLDEVRGVWGDLGALHASLEKALRGGSRWPGKPSRQRRSDWLSPTSGSGG